MAGSNDLAGQTAIVTGAAKRIGRAIALALAERGCDVCITYRRSATEAESTVAELKALGVRGFAEECDVTEAAGIAPPVARAIARLGRLDLLVNNAGVFASE